MCAKPRISRAYSIGFRRPNSKQSFWSKTACFLPSSGAIGDIGIRHKMPIIAFAKELSRSGMLMSYGPNIPGIFMRAGLYIDKILKGAKPADLPVEQPTKFELYINNRTAKGRVHGRLPGSVILRRPRSCAALEGCTTVTLRGENGGARGIRFKRCLANLCLVVTISRALYLDSTCDGARRFAASPAL